MTMTGRERDRRTAMILVLAAYGIAIVGFIVAHQIAPPTSGGPQPAGPSDFVAFGGVILGMFSGFMGAIYAHRAEAGAIRLLGIVAVLLGALLLWLASLGPFMA